MTLSVSYNIVSCIVDWGERRVRGELFVVRKNEKNDNFFFFSITTEVKEFVSNVIEKKREKTDWEINSNDDET